MKQIPKGTTWINAKKNSTKGGQHHGRLWIIIWVVNKLTEQMITRTFFFFFMLFSVCSVLLPVHTVPKWAAVWLCVTQVIPHMHGTSLDRVMDYSPTLSDSVPTTKSVSPNGEFPTVYVAGIAFFSFLQRFFLGAIKNPFSRRADRTRPTQGTGFRCLQIIHRPWLNAGTTMGGGGGGADRRKSASAKSQWKSQLKSILHLITSRR